MSHTASNRSEASTCAGRCRHGHLEATKQLLAGACKLDPQNQRRLTPLAEAVTNGHLAVAKLLASQGANAAVQPRGYTVLHLAAGMGNLEAAQYCLAELKADPNARGLRDGATPLHAACSSGRPGVVEALLAHGGDAGARDSNGRCPGNYIARDLDLETAQQLRQMVGSSGPGADDATTTSGAAAADGGSLSVIQGNCPPSASPNSTVAAVSSQTLRAAGVDPASLNRLDFAAAFGKLSVDDQIRKVNSWARLTAGELRDLAYLSAEHKKVGAGG